MHASSGAYFHFLLLAKGVTAAGSAGLHATLPLLIIGIMHLIDPEEMPLTDKLEWLGEPWAVALIGLVVLVEVVADKVPAVDHALHSVLAVVSPICGAVAAAAPDYGGGVGEPVLRTTMMVSGAAMAGTIHGGRAVTRVLATGACGGACSPFLSCAEDASVVVLLFISIAVGAVAVLAAMGVIALTAYCGLKMYQGGRSVGQRLQHARTAPAALDHESGGFPVAQAVPLTSPPAMHRAATTPPPRQAPLMTAVAPEAGGS